METVKVILFDLGNVLVHIDILNFPRALKINHNRFDELASQIHAIQQKYECGLITTDDFFSEVLRLSGNEFSRSELEKAFSTILCKPVDGMEEIVRKVSAKYFTALVSNTSEFHYLQSLQQVPAVHLLHKHYVSYKLKALKPQKEFYEKVLADLQKKPEEVVFIDDVEQNVQGAALAGMKTIHFHSIENLLEKFQEFSIVL